MDFNEWKTQGQSYFHKGKFRIFYQDAGTGTTLVLLHGFPTASWDWHKIWPSLIQEYRVIALDFMGFGFSAKPSDYTYNIADQADIVEYLLESLNIEKYHILAHDYGDTVAQELLARQFARQQVQADDHAIQSICFLNGGLFPETHQPRPIQKALIGPFGSFMKPFLTKSTLRKNFNKIFGPNTQASPQEIDEFYELMSFNAGKEIFHKLIRYMTEREKTRERWVTPLQESNVPVCLINGPADPVSGAHMVLRYKELVQDPVVFSLDNIGHYPQTEAPDEVLKCYGLFREEFG